MTEDGPIFVDLRKASSRTGLSVWYLRRGCISGDLPCIRSGKKYMVHLPRLLQTLENKAVEGVAADG